MGSDNGCNKFPIQVVSRHMVKASDPSIKPHILAISNLDLVPQSLPIAMVCIYRRSPTAGGINAVTASFEAGLPSLLNYYFPLAGRIATNPSSGLPEIHCNNHGAELVVGEAGVALASLDYGALDVSLRKVLLPCGGQDVALSVQVVSFACGGFTVAWRTNHLVVDGTALVSLVGAWSELARSGTLSAGARPNHDRTVFRPRATPAYAASLDKAFTPLDPRLQVNVLTTSESFVQRFYYIDASDIARLRELPSRDGGERVTRVQALSAYLWKALAGVVGTADPRCRMGWWVNGRPRLAAPELRAATRNYVGNLITLVEREVSVQEVQRMPLPDIAAMARETIAAPAYEEHFQELVDWVELHNTRRYMKTMNLGLGSPTLVLSSMTSFPVDTDFGFGSAVIALPVTMPASRMCTGFVQTLAKPGGDGSWIAVAVLWPRLAAALEADEPRIFRPLTAEYLGLFAPQLKRGRL
ncbi:omega-hydroxypalmitate O-feruloyl transferase-like [Panicum miliaceum]|uniref:Omega-hydroxypalmitate O-feruloyl transferase-like n=1 Tax=Panicum miliaceum TaxID=4540 RepID=A0A3L6Q1X0_PANMI|nr:omega-hydroxypalmitate O-feruloyl transferase-like [Panicum miliaceum]